ncbi:hypothetical protein A5320_10575 [Rheinheimera sp. SA_1]|uniref:beta/gamma crystallin-related protein n=1 Tax=Rheinheimera sp. SA_1 TaxID=1827365 RepID=UPI0007FEC5DF|nr:beta/gamma crystallin-related protein [Rheinheimera sp. SA_1]OBP15728.1 hypothetical protein A5320_10575 [Rheinheimera sp. SA_1]
MNKTLLAVLALVSASSHAGVTLYEHSYFSGSAKYVTDGEMIDEVKKQNVFDNDALSSIKVEAGSCVVLFQNAGYSSTAKYFSAGEYSDLAQYGFDNQTTSLQVFKHHRCDSEIMNHFYGDRDYQALSFTLPPSGFHRDLGQGNWNTVKNRVYHANDYISSVKVGVGSCVTMYEHNHFQGRSIKFGTNVSDLVPRNFNDIASSVLVTEGSCSN